MRKQAKFKTRELYTVWTRKTMLELKGTIMHDETLQQGLYGQTNQELTQSRAKQVQDKGKHRTITKKTFACECWNIWHCKQIANCKSIENPKFRLHLLYYTLILTIHFIRNTGTPDAASCFQALICCVFWDAFPLNIIVKRYYFSFKGFLSTSLISLIYKVFQPANPALTECFFVFHIILYEPHKTHKPAQLVQTTMPWLQPLISHFLIFDVNINWRSWPIYACILAFCYWLIR